MPYVTLRRLAALLALSCWPMSAPADPFLWLEEVEGPEALAWVRERNARFLPELEATPGFATWRERAQAMLEDPRRMALPTGAQPTGLAADRVFNFWRDERHVRGLWRASARADYEAGQPQWTTLLDLDRLAEAEGRNWQWAGALCLPPAFQRCLVRLSVGGRDAVEVREFDTRTKQFVPQAAGGFALGEAKQQAAFVHADLLMVATASGPSTTSGYAREVRLWTRGTPWSEARLLLQADETDMGVWPMAFGEAESRRHVIDRRITFFTGRLYHLMADWTLAPSPLPEDADFRFIATLGDGQGPRAFALLRSPLGPLPAGSLVAYAVPNVGRPGPLEPVLSPNDRQAIVDVAATGQALYVHLLDDVAARLVRLTPDGRGGWNRTDVAVPELSSLTLLAADAKDTLAFTVSSFVEPDRLMLARGGTPREVARNPAHVDPATLAVERRFTRSRDGTRVPFFVVRPKARSGPLPTLLFAYGGFEIPLTPAYPPPEALMWVEAGGQYAVANIRGGGEYGPRWHQAALRAKRQRAYDDLHAVARALKRTGLASRLAIHGRSNGGLLAGVAFTQRPDLYDAALVGVPLADMRRYHRLLAGASWMAEYGNPDDPADWAFLARISPYHNLRAGVRYPRVFLYTSTKDDRVHPAHARKMAARLEALGHPYYYYENVDGGHAGVANLKEQAYRAALFRAYLERELGRP
ncbi:MAG: prolyl oligopeptidase family serine peptidase [Sphingomonadaceae bacterium]|uniref:prolyl oligopeptidase family serine peptidase n=1 Tax=Thermaurantiacus sp. TaxID=2820283 RepID=UPI00298ED299|nr:prolyl oligopeptidase family serine peptidase [Thermaurantiacus sp.]MCS6987646.1 prolyl oligopeptidase family serine peptidase [Sphingomonadaceae bacterium]MDW8415247.1 prolyl oligopeptidase family serine peptidase [Thermaurantiacus sp.]